MSITEYEDKSLEERVYDTIKEYESVDPGDLFFTMRSSDPNTDDMAIRWAVGTLLAARRIILTFDRKFRVASPNGNH